MLTTSVIRQGDEEVSVKGCLKGARCFASKINDHHFGNKRLNPIFAEVVGNGTELLYSAPHL